MRERTYRPAKPQLMAAVVLLIMLAAALFLTAIYAHWLLKDTLEEGRTNAQAEQVTQFTLKEQMVEEQARTRVRGWLSQTEQEDVSIQTQRAVLHGSVFSPVSGGDAPWALVLHGGLGTDRNQVMDVACALSLRGYHVLAPDLYAHGMSEGTISSLGLADAQDVRAWCEWIIRRDADARIVIFGQDEGGFAALMAAAQGLPQQVCAVAADSAYRSVSERLSALLNVRKDQKSRVQGMLLELAYRMTHGVDAKEGELMPLLADCELPLLLLHGTGDQDVPAWHSEDLAAAGKDARLLFVEGAAHGMARYADAEKYYAALHAFFEEAL